MKGPSRTLVGLVGWPVEHSISPAMHNAAYRELGLAWHYQLLPTAPDTLGTVLHNLEASGYAGANVTVPHKQAVMAHLDQVSESARAVGAVNTIVARRGHLLGHNTDGHGFLVALKESGFQPGGKQALVLGAGGGARAVVYSLAEAGCAVTLHNRTAERAQSLASDMEALGLRARVNTVMRVRDLAGDALAYFDLLVNTTPAGMWPETDRSPWPEAHTMPGHWLVFDLVYNPRETRLLAQARQAGARTIGGLGMLVHQGARAFELWTGEPPPVAVMRREAELALGR